MELMKRRFLIVGSCQDETYFITGDSSMRRHLPIRHEVGVHEEGTVVTVRCGTLMLLVGSRSRGLLEELQLDEDEYRAAHRLWQ